MDSVKAKPVAGLVHSFTKTFRRKAAGGGVVADFDARKPSKFPDVVVDDAVSRTSDSDVDEKLKARRKMEKEAKQALLAELFADVSAIKAAYAQLQAAQSPYDPESIQLADEAIVSELTAISNVKQSYSKKQFIQNPPEWKQAQMQAEVQEQRNLLKTYEIMEKKLQSQLQQKESELVFLKQKLKDSTTQARQLEKRLDPKAASFTLDNLHFSAIDPGHFVAALRHAGRAIRSFSRHLFSDMESAGWDLDAVAGAIQPATPIAKPTHRLLAVESFVNRTIFSHFHHPGFSPDGGVDRRKERRRYFEEFAAAKSADAGELLAGESSSEFAEFCRRTYLNLVHPRLESGLVGDLRCRAAIRAGGFPDSPLPALFVRFLEVAKRVWSVHRLAFSFDPEADIFQVRPGTRFSEVYMESACDDPPNSVGPIVGFTVSPGFSVGKTVAQCRVYLVPGENLGRSSSGRDRTVKVGLGPADD